jgi:hypothetical protein
LTKKIFTDYEFKNSACILDKEPTADSHAVNKKYVDDAVSTIGGARKHIPNSKITIKNTHVDDDDQKDIAKQEIIATIPDADAATIDFITLILNGIVYYSEDCFTATIATDTSVNPTVKKLILDWDFESLFIIDNTFNIVIEYNA